MSPTPRKVPRVSSGTSDHITVRQLVVVLSLPLVYLWVVFALRVFSLATEGAGSILLFSTAGAWSPVNVWEASFGEVMVPLLVVLSIASVFPIVAWLKRNRPAAWFGFGILASGPLIWLLRVLVGMGYHY